MAQLSIDVKARTAQFQDGMNRVKRQSQGVIRDLTSGFSGLRATFLALGGAAVFTGFLGSLKSVATELDGLRKAAQGAGETTEALSELRYAFELSGLEARETDRALTTLAKRLDEAKRGTGEAARGFAALQIDPSQFTRASDAIFAISQEFTKLGPTANRALIAQQLFGEELGARVTPALLEGGEGLRKIIEDFRSFNGTVDEATAASATRFLDQMTRLNAQLTAISRTLAGPMIEHLADFIDTFKKLREAGVGPLDAFATAGLTDDELSAAIELQTQALAKLKKRRDDLVAQINNPRDDVFEKAFLVTAKQSLKLVDADIALTNARLDALIKRQFSPPKSSSGTGGDGQANGTSGVADLGKELDAGEKLLDQLRSRLIATQDLNEEQKTRIELARQGVQGDDALDAIDLSKRIDAQRQLNTELEAQRDLNNLIADAQGRAAERLASEIEGYKDLANPFRQTYFEIQRIQELASKGLLSPDVADGAIEALTKTNAEAEKLQSNLNESNELSKDFWLSFQSGAEDAIFAGEKLSDVISALIEDFGRLAFRAALQQLGTSLGIGVATGAAPAAGGGASTGGVVVQDGLKIPKATGLQTTAVTNNYYIPAAVSMTEVEGAIARGNARTKGDIYDSKQRGGVFA